MPMDEDARAAAIQQGVQAFLTDPSLLAGLVSEEFIWHLTGSSPLAGDYVGREAVLGYFRRILEMADEYAVVARETGSTGTHLVVVGTSSGPEPPATFAPPVARLLTCSSS